MRAILSVAVGIGAVVALGACGTPVATPVPTPSPSGSPAIEGDGVLRIGTLVPASGTFAFLAPAEAAGISLAVADINAAGGVNGKPVEVLARDTADASSTTAETAFADLVANKADVVVGPSSSALAERLIPASSKAKIPLMSPAATFTGLTHLSDAGYFFRTIPTYEDQGFALGKALTENKTGKVALLYVNDDLGTALAGTLKQSLDADGGHLVVSEGFPAGITDLGPILAKVTDAKPDVVVLASAYSSFDLTKALITQVLAAGYGGAKLWLTTQNTGDYSQAFPNGTLNTVNGIIEGVEPDDAFKARLKTVDGTLTSFRYSAESYDATILAALAAIVAGDDSGARIAATLEDVSKGGIKCTSFTECLDVLKTQHDIDYDGISGPVNFSADGDVSPAYYGLYGYNGENKFVFARAVLAG